MARISGMHEDGQAKSKESVNCDQDPGEGSGWDVGSSVLTAGRPRPAGSELLLGSTLSPIQGLTSAMAFSCSSGVFLQQCRAHQPNVGQYLKFHGSSSRGCRRRLLHVCLLWTEEQFLFCAELISRLCSLVTSSCQNRGLSGKHPRKSQNSHWEQKHSFTKCLVCSYATQPNGQATSHSPESVKTQLCSHAGAGVRSALRRPTGRITVVFHNAWGRHCAKVLCHA